MQHDRPTPKELEEMIKATFQIEKYWYKGLDTLTKEDQKTLTRNIQNIRRLLSDIEIEQQLKATGGK